MLSYPHGNKMEGNGPCALFITWSAKVDATPIDNIKEWGKKQIKITKLSLQ
jgi:hypothetical protein